MGVNHRGRDIGMSQQLLHGANVATVFQQVRREAMSQRVATGGLGNLCATHGVLDFALHGAFVDVMPADGARLAIRERAARWKVAGIPIHRDHAAALKTLGESLKLPTPIV
jgi:hypothetical protein